MRPTAFRRTLVLSRNRVRRPSPARDAMVVREMPLLRCAWAFLPDHHPDRIGQLCSPVRHRARGMGARTQRDQARRRTRGGGRGGAVTWSLGSWGRDAARPPDDRDGQWRAALFRPICIPICSPCARPNPRDGQFRPMELVPSVEVLSGNGADVIVTRDERFPLDEMFYVSGEIPRVTRFERGFPGQYRQTAADKRNRSRTRSCRTNVS